MGGGGIRAPGPFRVAHVSLGCRTNRADTDAVAAELARRGIVASAEKDADVIVVNTCAVTGEAEAKARKAVRHAASFPQVRGVIATGCVATLAADALAAACPGVIVVANKSEIADRVIALLGGSRAVARAAAGTPGIAATGLGAPKAIARVTPTGRTRPNVKIQDGCDNRCTYCIVWRARGAARSVGAAEVTAEVTSAVAAGAAEVVLTGINVGRYADPAVGDLAGLLRHLLATTDVGRLRLASIEPPDVTDALLTTIATSNGRVAPFLHVCLQAGCDATLARMGRAYDTATFARVLCDARTAVPDIALGTDVIVGFPGETDADFAETVAFCRACAFARMHVFRYSARPHTPAAAMADRVDARVSAARAAEMRALAAEMRAAYAAARVGSEEVVLVQAPGRGITGALFDARLDKDIPVGTLVHVRVRAVDGCVLVCR